MLRLGILVFIVVAIFGILIAALMIGCHSDSGRVQSTWSDASNPVQVNNKISSSKDAGATNQEKVTFISSSGKRKWDAVLYKNSKGIQMLEVVKNKPDECIAFPEYDKGVIRADGKWYLASGRSLESGQKTVCIEGIFLEPIKGNTFAALRAAMPNITGVYQGLPECKLPTSNMTLVQAVAFMKQKRLFGVIALGNAGKLLQYANPKLEEKYDYLNKWPYILHLSDGREVRVFKAGSDGRLDTAWTHFVMPASLKGKTGIADHYAGLDTATYPGYISMIERHGALNTDFQDGVSYQDIHTSEYYNEVFSDLKKGSNAWIYTSSKTRVDGELESKPKYTGNKVIMVINTKSPVEIGGEKIQVAVGSIIMDGKCIAEDTLKGFKLVRVEAKVPKGT